MRGKKRWGWKKREDRRERPSNDCGERDEMELLCSNVKESDEYGKKKRREKKRMNKTDKLEREEKQPEGIKLSPFSSI